jgi:DNA polymerase III subunit epsilon
MNPLNLINSSNIKKMNSPSSKNTRIRRILVFDTETSGLLQKKEPDITKQPYILQLSFIVFNIEFMEIEQKYNQYIKVGNEIEISDTITRITGITREICDTKGISIIRALMDFHDAYIQCDCIIAHNLEFDSKMIQFEFSRNITEIKAFEPHIMDLFNKNTDLQLGIVQYCTMKESMNLVASPSVSLVPNSSSTIIGTKPAYSQYKKWHKLSELYEKIFHTIPENLHNSWFDTMICFRCFMVIKFQYRIPDDYYENLLKL